MSRLPRAILGAAVALAVILLAPGGPALANCDGFGPSVAAVRDTALVIVDGTVSWVKPSAGHVPSSWFDVQVERAIRGAPGAVVRVRGLNGSSCGGQPILMSTGQHVILAIGAREFGRTMGAFYVYDGAGRITSSTFAASGPFPATKGDLLRILAVAPDTATAEATERPADVPWLPMIMTSLGGATAMAQRLRRHTPGSPRA